MCASFFGAQQRGAMRGCSTKHFGFVDVFDLSSKIVVCDSLIFRFYVVVYVGRDHRSSKSRPVILLVCHIGCSVCISYLIFIGADITFVYVVLCRLRVVIGFGNSIVGIKTKSKTKVSIESEKTVRAVCCQENFPSAVHDVVEKMFSIRVVGVFCKTGFHRAATVAEAAASLLCYIQDTRLFTSL